MKNKEKRSNKVPSGNVLSVTPPLCSCCFKHVAGTVTFSNPEGLCFKCLSTGCPERFAELPSYHTPGRAWRQRIGMAKIDSHEDEM